MKNRKSPNLRWPRTGEAVTACKIEARGHETIPKDGRGQLVPVSRPAGQVHPHYFKSHFCGLWTREGCYDLRDTTG